MADALAPSPGPGVALAIVTGCFYAAAANLVSYVAHQEALERGRRFSRCQQRAVEITAFAGYIAGGLLVTAAYACGDSVPVVNATMVATNLLANMLLQVWLGITYYTKSMRMGTVIFVVAVFQLAYLGPVDRGEVDVLQMFARPVALAWLGVVAVLLAVSGAGLRLTTAEPAESWPKIAAWALFISCLGAGTDNAASTFGLLKGWTLCVALGAYGLISVFLMMLSAKAPGVCDAAVYVPLQLCTQLVFNMLTGFFVWRDSERLAALAPYLVVFAICVLSVYLASDNVDLFAGVTRWKVAKNSLSDSAFGRSMMALLEGWQEIRVSPGPRAEAAGEAALRGLLDVGLTRGLFDEKAIADLLMLLQKEHGTFGATVPMVEWMEQNLIFRKCFVSDPDLWHCVRDALPPQERLRLPAPNFAALQLSSSEEDGETSEKGPHS